MFLIDFSAPCGVLGVAHPDTISPVLLPAIEVLGATDIVNLASPALPKNESSLPLLGNESYAALVGPDWPKPRIESSQPLRGPESYSAFVVPDFPKPKIESLLLISPDFPAAVTPDWPKQR